MINRDNIPEGATVFVARRGLTAEYHSLMRVEKMVVVKRTPKGYTLTHGHATIRHQDDRYYISENEAEVLAALYADASDAHRTVIELTRATAGVCTDLLVKLSAAKA